MNCSKCNSQNEETAKFCQNCGANLSTTTVVEQNKKSKVKRNGYGIAGLVFSIIAIFAISADKRDAPPPIAIIVFSLLGLSFSLIGFFQKDKKKTTAIIGFVISIVVLIVFIIGLGYNNFSSRKDVLTSDISVNKTEEEKYQFTFNGIRLNSGMSLENIKEANPNIRMEKKKTPGYNSLLGSTEPYTYYDVYSPSNDRACVIVPYNNNSKVYSITFLTDDYKTHENIRIGSTWGDVEKAYPNGEWQFYYWAFDYYTYSNYDTWIYYYVPSICSYFVFKGSQFSETQIQALYSTVSNDVISISSVSSSIYSSICASISVYQIVAVDCNNAQQTQRKIKNENVDSESEFSPESIARKFCTAVYQKNMVKAKSFMTIEDAKLTPDKMSLTDEECILLLGKLNHASFKTIPNEYTDKIVTIRFYDPNYDYLAKNNRWFCCSVELSNTSGTWKVINYGY